MSIRPWPALRVPLAVCAAGACFSHTFDAQTPSSYKVAFFNIQAGKGEQAVAGYYAPFTENMNCTDPAQPLNAWGVGFLQQHLRAGVGNDPAVVALGLAEAWTSTCGSHERVRQALGWQARTGEQNGVAIVARYGFAGPEEWRQLDTSLNPNPSDTMWIVRAPVCLDAGCSRSINVFAGHWMGSDTATGSASLDRQGRQTIEFLRSRGGSEPHVLIADLNAWEGQPACSQTPDGSGLSHLRDAGYIDAWPALHGNAEGFTGMVNRANCGVPLGYPFKRIDYAWSPPGYHPLSINRFAMVPPGDGAPSDHYGIIAEYPWPGTAVPPPLPPPPPPPPPPPSGTDLTHPEVVLHARTASTIAGAWRVDADPEAAGGARVTHPDAGQPKVAEPLASPPHFFELSFTAQAGVPYHLWIRGRAARDHYSNDSVYAQFSGSVDGSGAPRWRIGSSSGTKLVLEDCSGCTLSGWGWQDNAYGPGVPDTPVYFATTGLQTIRIQAREDGISIDQIVLSARTYLTQAPGATTGDRTLLAAIGGSTAGGTGTANLGEIVILGSEAARTAGRWIRAADATAAGGMAATHPNADAARVPAPQTSPSDFVEFSFDALAGTPYRLWIRGRADNDLWSNDSVYIQFSGTVTSAGEPIYRIGTTSATSFNLEEASNVGVSGWGWQDNGYGLNVWGPLLTFASAGPQTIRIQTREDGLRIDQIVLSSSTYLTRAPGAAKNDNTRLR